MWITKCSTHNARSWRIHGNKFWFELCLHLWKQITRNDIHMRRQWFFEKISAMNFHTRGHPCQTSTQSSHPTKNRVHLISNAFCSKFFYSRQQKRSVSASQIHDNFPWLQGNHFIHSTTNF